MKITVPDVCLVVLVGASSAGKSTFALRHFRPSEVVSSDQCRLMVADDENDPTATPAAFDLLHTIVSKRLDAGRLTVVDATSLVPADRRPLLSLAQAYHVPAVAVVLSVPYEVAVERNARREDRELPVPTLRTHVERAERSTAEQLEGEGFAQVFTLAVDEVGATDGDGSKVTVERIGPPTDRTDEHGPFDIFGDVHGCLDELVELLAELGYEVAADRASADHPDGRKAVFVGDLVDRGPDTPGVLKLVTRMVRDGAALCVPGNHEARLVRAVRGTEATTGHGLTESLEQLAASSPELRDEVIEFLEGLPSHVVLDDGDLVVAHAGLPAHMHNRDSAAVRWFTLYGDTSGETDDFGHQVRYPWAREYRGDALVVYGHIPVKEPEWLNNTICVDTGCVYGGRLTALRYPERELVSVPAAKVYYQSAGSPDPDAETTTVVSTRLAGDVSVPLDERAAAEEAAGKAGVDPGWRVFVPHAVPPGPVTTRADLLEHPEDSFLAYAEAGVDEVVCEYSHAGSQAVAVLCRDAEAAERRFGVTWDGSPDGSDKAVGSLHTLDAIQPDASSFEELYQAVEKADLWSELATDWLVLEVTVLSGQRLAPITVLAAESGVWAGEDRLWHLAVAERLHDASPQHLVATRHTRVAVADVPSRARGIAWWQDVVSSGGAGMVIRPLSLPAGDGRLVQPALQCRGPAYLQTLFGEDYALPENMLRLRDRDVGREFAVAREAFALGVEGLERFVAGEPLDRVHECYFGALALAAARLQ